MATRHLDLDKLAGILHRLAHPSDHEVHKEIDALTGQDDEAAAEKDSAAKKGGE